MAELLDPVIYEEFYGLRKASEEYLSTILRKTNYTKEEIGKISDGLIFSLPTHGFVIDRNLALEMGLKVSLDSEDSEEWELMRNWFVRYVGEETDKHFIRYCIPHAGKNN